MLKMKTLSKMEALPRELRVMCQYCTERKLIDIALEVDPTVSDQLICHYPKRYCPESHHLIYYLLSFFLLILRSSVYILDINLPQIY